MYKAFNRNGQSLPLFFVSAEELQELRKEQEARKKKSQDIMENMPKYRDYPVDAAIEKNKGWSSLYY